MLDAKNRGEKFAWQIKSDVHEMKVNKTAQNLYMHNVIFSPTELITIKDSQISNHNQILSIARIIHSSIVQYYLVDESYKILAFLQFNEPFYQASLTVQFLPFMK